MGSEQKKPQIELKDFFFFVFFQFKTIKYFRDSLFTKRSLDDSDFISNSLFDKK